jgi:hypothetical protein
LIAVRRTALLSYDALMAFMESQSSPGIFPQFFVIVTGRSSPKIWRSNFTSFACGTRPLITLCSAFRALISSKVVSGASRILFESSATLSGVSPSSGEILRLVLYSPRSAPRARWKTTSPPSGPSRSLAASETRRPFSVAISPRRFLTAPSAPSSVRIRDIRACS